MHFVDEIIGPLLFHLRESFAHLHHALLGMQFDHVIALLWAFVDDGIGVGAGGDVDVVVGVVVAPDVLLGGRMKRQLF